MNATQLLTHFDRLAEAPDAVPRLRRFILDLAVRGKLVEQDASDESSLVLLARIQNAKSRLIEAKTLKKITLSTLAPDDEPRVLPVGWTLSHLGDVYDVRDGTHATPKYVDRGIPLVTSKNLSSGRLDFDDIKLISQADHDEISRRSRVSRDDVLFAMIGSIGNPVIVDTDKPFSIKNVALFKYYDRDLSSPRFLLLYLQQVAHSMRATATGGLQPFVSLGMLRSSPFNLPPLAEQHRIVAKVDELMALCDQLEAAQHERERRRDRLAAASLQRLNQPAEANRATDQTEHTEARQQAQREQQKDSARFHLQNLNRLTTRPEHIKAMRQTFLNLAVRGKLLRQDANDASAHVLLTQIEIEKSRASRKKLATKRAPGESIELPPFFGESLPDGWAISKLGDLCTKTGSGSTPAGGKDAYVPSGTPFLRSQNIYDDGLRMDSVAYISEATQARMSATTVMPKDVLLNITGGSIGRCAIVPDTFDAANINQHVAIIRLAVPDCGRFVHCVIRSDYFQSQIFGNQTGAGREGLPKNRMDEIPIPVPPLAEQHRIVAKVDELMALCDQLEAQLTQSQTDSRRLLEAVLEAALTPA